MLETKLRGYLYKTKNQIFDNYSKNIKTHYENEIHNFHYEMKKV